MIELTEQQQQAILNEDPPRVVNPCTGVTYVLIRSEVYESLGQVLNDRSQEAIPEVPEGILAAQQAFWKDLPELLKNRKLHDLWVAYHRSERIGIDRDPRMLRLEIQRRAIPEDEYHLDLIQPHNLPPWGEEEIEPIHPHHFQETE